MKLRLTTRQPVVKAKTTACFSGIIAGLFLVQTVGRSISRRAPARNISRGAKKRSHTRRFVYSWRLPI
jgi:hypothetical protein